MTEAGVKTFLVRCRPDSDFHEWLGEAVVHDLEEQMEKAVATRLPVTISVV